MKEASLQIQKLEQQSSPQECKKIISALIFNLTNQHLNISDLRKAGDTMLYLQLKSTTLRDWVVFVNDEESIDEARCKLVTMQPDTSLYQAALELDRLGAKQLVIQDHHTDIIGILNRRNIIDLIRRYLRLDFKQAQLFKQPILKMNFLLSSPAKKSPLSSPRISRRNSNQHLSPAQELCFTNVSADESLLQAFKLMFELNVEYLSVVEQNKATGMIQITGLLFATDVIYILRKKNYLQLLESKTSTLVKQINCLNHIHLPLLDDIPQPSQEQLTERAGEEIFDDVQESAQIRSMGNSRKFSMAESDGLIQNEEFKGETSDLGVSLAAGFGSYEISNQGGTLGLNSTTATTRRNKEQGQTEEEKKQRDIPGFFRVRKLEPNDSLVDVVGKIFQSEEKILVGLSESGLIKTSVCLGDLFDYMVRSASQFQQ